MGVVDVVGKTYLCLLPFTQILAHPFALLTIRLGGAGIDGSLGRFDASLTSDNPRLRKALRRRAMRDGHAGGMVCRGRDVMTIDEAASMYVSS